MSKNSPNYDRCDRTAKVQMEPKNLEMGYQTKKLQSEIIVVV